MVTLSLTLTSTRGMDPRDLSVWHFVSFHSPRKLLVTSCPECPDHAEFGSLSGRNTSRPTAETTLSQASPAWALSTACCHLALARQ